MCFIHEFNSWRTKNNVNCKLKSCYAFKIGVQCTTLPIKGKPIATILLHVEYSPPPYCICRWREANYLSLPQWIVGRCVQSNVQLETVTGHALCDDAAARSLDLGLEQKQSQALALGMGVKPLIESK